MTHLELVPVPPVAQLAGVSQHYGKTVALNNITLDIPARCMVGLIGPDGVGKSSLLSLISGARVIEQGSVMVLGGGNVAYDCARTALRLGAKSPGCRRGWAKISTTPCRCMKTSIFSPACSVTTKRSGKCELMSC